MNTAELQPFSDLVAQINAIREIPAWRRGNADARAAVAGIAEAEAVLAMARLELVADLDRRDDAIPGCRAEFVARTFLRRRLHRTSSQAKLEVECAHRLAPDADPLTGGLPLFAHALAAGEVSRDHAEVAVRAMQKLSREELATPRRSGLFGSPWASASTSADIADPRSGEPTDDAGLDDAGLDSAGLISADPDHAGLDADGNQSGSPTSSAGTNERPPWPGPCEASVVPKETTMLTGHAVDEVLTAYAKRHDCGAFATIARRLVAAIKDDDRDGFDPHDVDRRFVDHAQDPATGMIVGKFALDGLNGAWFETAMDHFTRRDEQRDEPTRDGGGSVVTPVRTPGQARADTLGEICRIALIADEAGATTGGERPRIVITTGILTLRDALLHDSATEGHPVPSPAGTKNPAQQPEGGQSTASIPAAFGRPASEAPDGRRARCDQICPIGGRLLGVLACDSIFQQAVFGPSGAVLSLGRETRTITKAQRRALSARDRGCVMPGCTAPARRCQGHHVRWWRHGGESDLDNLALLCSACHTQIHLDSGWELVMVDGVPWARPPDWLDAERRLIRNTYHDDLDQAGDFGSQLKLNLNPSEHEPAAPERERPPGQAVAEAPVDSLGHQPGDSSTPGLNQSLDQPLDPTHDAGRDVSGNDPSRDDEDQGEAWG